MSLYGERCGALSVVCASREEALNVLGQLKFTVRRNYSSPPIHGGQLVAAVLGDTELRPAWERELATMRERIQAMRKALHATLTRKMPARRFDYFLTQRGMFSYTGLSPAQVDRLRETSYAVYLGSASGPDVRGRSQHRQRRSTAAIASLGCAVLRPATSSGRMANSSRDGGAQAGVANAGAQLRLFPDPARHVQLHRPEPRPGVDRLRDEFAVYLVRSGRMCVAGLNTGNVEATGLAMAAVLDG